MTSGSRLGKVSLPRSVGGFHGVRAYSGVFQAPSPYSLCHSWRWASGLVLGDVAYRGPCLVVMSSSIVFLSNPIVFWVVRWLMLEKVPGVTTLWGLPSLEAKPSQMVGCHKHGALIHALPVTDKPQLGA
jgi:hypothetical protein